jgi:hypothetical protein
VKTASDSMSVQSSMRLKLNTLPCALDGDSCVVMPGGGRRRSADAMCSARRLTYSNVRVVGGAQPMLCALEGDGCITTPER